MDKTKKISNKFSITMELLPMGTSDFENQSDDSKKRHKEHPLHTRMKVRILYKGRNRNRSFIDDSAEEQIINTLRDVPIVGEYWETIEDFGTHGMEIRSDEHGDLKFKRTTVPFGFVPSDADVWHEEVMDKDGQKRQYLTTECVLWSKRYPELNSLIMEGRPQSMELDPESMEGDWILFEDENEYYFKFSNVNLSALCILGSEIEPCFEGASFVTFSCQNNWSEFRNECQQMFNDIKAEYNLENNLENFSKKIEQLNNVPSEDSVIDNKLSTPDTETRSKIKVFTTGLNVNNKGGKFNMGEFKLQFANKNDIREILYKSVNAYNAEENVVDYKYSITEIKPDVFTAFNSTDNKFYKFSYSIKEDEVKLGQPTSIQASFNTKEEKDAIDEQLKMFSVKEAEVNSLESTVKELKTSLKDYQLTKTEYENIKTDADKYHEIKDQFEVLKQFRDKTELSAKQEILERFSVLGEGELKNFRDNLSKYTADELDEKLSVIAFRKGITLNKEVKDPNKVVDNPAITFSYEPEVKPEDEVNVDMPAWFSMAENTDRKLRVTLD